jgi:hypothetical protein
MSAPQHPHPIATFGRWLALAAAAALLIDSLPEARAQAVPAAAALSQGTDVPGIDP